MTREEGSIIKPQRFVHQAGAAQIIGVHKQGIYTRRQNDRFLDPDIMIDGKPGWSRQRLDKFKDWLVTGDKTKLPNWWHAEPTRYLSYTELARELGWRPAYIWIKAGRGELPTPQVILGYAEIADPSSVRQATGLAPGETAGWSHARVIEWGQQEGRLDKDGNLIAPDAPNRVYAS